MHPPSPQSVHNSDLHCFDVLETLPPPRPLPSFFLSSYFSRRPTKDKYIESASAHHLRSLPPVDRSWLDAMAHGFRKDVFGSRGFGCVTGRRRGGGVMGGLTRGNWIEESGWFGRGS